MLARPWPWQAARPGPETPRRALCMRARAATHSTTLPRHFETQHLLLLCCVSLICWCLRLGPCSCFRLCLCQTPGPFLGPSSPQTRSLCVTAAAAALQRAILRSDCVVRPCPAARHSSYRLCGAALPPQCFHFRNACRGLCLARQSIHMYAHTMIVQACFGITLRQAIELGALVFSSCSEGVTHAATQQTPIGFAKQPPELQLVWHGKPFNRIGLARQAQYYRH